MKEKKLKKKILNICKSTIFFKPKNTLIFNKTGCELQLENKHKKKKRKNKNKIKYSTP